MAIAASETIRNNGDGNPVPAIMTYRSLALSFGWLAVLGSCGQMPSRPLDTGTPGPRYVDVTVLTNGDECSGVQVLTSVPLRHISARDAEARLQASLPEGVRVSSVGETAQLLVQGPRHSVTELIKEIERLDVR